MRSSFILEEKASGLHKRVLHGQTMAALWTGIRVYVLKDREMILQEDFGARSKRVLTFLIPTMLWGKRVIYILHK